MITHSQSMTQIKRTTSVADLQNILTKSDPPTRKIYSPGIRPTLQEELEVHKLVHSVSAKYKHIKELFETTFNPSRFNHIINNNNIYGLSYVSEQIIRSIDEFLVIYRKVRRRFQQIGFSRLRLMNKFQLIPDILAGVGHVQQMLILTMLLVLRISI